MLNYFPTPYPDEILYSILARYSVKVGNLSAKVALRDLYDITSVTAVVDLPGHISRLVGRLPLGGYTAEKLIYNHTLFPFYSPFLSDERAQLVFASMKGDYGGDIHTRIGIMASSIHSPHYLRFCPTCAQEDYRTYGELYWHRSHQLTGIVVCDKHKVALRDSSVLIHGFNKHKYVPATIENCMGEDVCEVRNIRNLDILHQISEDSRFLLNQHLPSRELNWYRDRYITRLSNKGLVTPKGCVAQQEFNKGFINFYGRETLEALGVSFGINSESNWLRAIVRKHRKSFHPLKHILLIRFLFGALQDFFDYEGCYSPFGEPDWPCLNPVAGHYLSPVITEVEITRGSKTGKPVGTFKCSCGFVYARTGPDRCDKDRIRVGRVKEFGHVWNERLIELITKNKSGLRETARRMHCDPKTIKFQANRLGITAPQEDNGSVVSLKVGEFDYNSLLENYRTKFKELIKSNPNASKTEVRRQTPGVYSWLYRHDREWLNDNSPEIKRRVSSAGRIDWNVRDVEIAEKVRKTVEALLKAEGKPKQITVSRVGKMVGKLAILEKHLDKLPRTREYLLKIVENIEDFQMRRIHWAAKVLEQQGEELRPWRIIRLAGLKSRPSTNLYSEIKRVCSNKSGR
ncbi:hypothetical protein SDC9_45764 [bioreactor metagenome]|uniref:Uncharacterized protein n=1 Tax=bioreactor metagenome TaxID=1076179 RepID=A0A644W7S6_9ZZZZ|nr:TnsD family transposase [Desulfitobacterium hafniense]MEA5025893.1 TnsD family transposase [Desulfitobacterium hafniense]